MAASIAGTLSITLLILNLSSGERKIEYRIAPLYATGEAQFIRALGNLLGPPLVDGNRVTELKNGDEICPAMLEAIRGARRPTQDHAGDLHLLVGNHRQRVHGRAVRASPQRLRVHVLLDWVGTEKMESGDLDRMRKAGIEVEKYHPLRWYSLARLNKRTHRKLMVVDGKIGFTGGVGIADKWMGQAENEEHWRDSHFRVEGPVVARWHASCFVRLMEVSEPWT